VCASFWLLALLGGALFGLGFHTYIPFRFALSHLAKCFVSGEPVPKQRRTYKKRVVKSKEYPARIPIGLSRLSDSPEPRMTGNGNLYLNGRTSVFGVLQAPRNQSSEIAGKAWYTMTMSKTVLQ
jgi:hypothetical protein